MRASYLVPVMTVLAFLVAGLGATYASARTLVRQCCTFSLQRDFSEIRQVETTY
jgi:hypothetical protein